MALTITVAQLSQAVRLTVTGSPAPPLLAIVTRLLAVAQVLIEGYVNDDCPDDVKNEAAIIVRWLTALLRKSVRQRSRDPFANSGAKALLSRWHDLGERECMNMQSNTGTSGPVCPAGPPAKPCDHCWHHRSFEADGPRCSIYICCKCTERK